MNRLIAWSLRCVIGFTALLNCASGEAGAEKRAAVRIRSALTGTWKAVDTSAVKSGPVILGFDPKGLVCEWGVAEEQRDGLASLAFDPFHRKGGVTYRIDTSPTPPVVVMTQRDIIGDPVAQNFEVITITRRAMTLEFYHMGQHLKVNYEKVSDNPRHFARKPIRDKK